MENLARAIQSGITDDNPSPLLLVLSMPIQDQYFRILPVLG